MPKKNPAAVAPKYRLGYCVAHCEAACVICRKAAAVALGSIKSPRKAKSSRENGKKGGRPKKST